MCLAKRLKQVVYISYNLDSESAYLTGTVEKALLRECKKLFPSPQKTQLPPNQSTSTPNQVSSQIPVLTESLGNLAIASTE